MIVLYHPVKAAFKGRPGIARGWATLIENALPFSTPQAAIESLPANQREDWHVLRVNLERVPEHELLLC